MGEYRLINCVVCYKNETEIIEYANNIAHLDCSEYVLLLISVNDYSDEYDYNKFSSEILKVNQHTRIFECGENKGYLNGMIYGYHVATSTDKFSDVKWVILGNTDIRIDDKTFFMKLLNSHYQDDVACIAPVIYVPSRDCYENHYLNRHTKKKLLTLIFAFSNVCTGRLYLILSKIKKEKKGTKKTQPKSGYIYSAHGSFFAVSREVADYIVANPYPCLMYSEEYYISYIVESLGMKEYCDSNLRIVHYGNQVTNKLPGKKRIKMQYDSILYIYRLCYGKGE